MKVRTSALRTSMLTTLLLLAVAAYEVRSTEPGDGDELGFCAAADGLRTGKRPMIDVRLDDALGRNEIVKSQSERSPLSGRLQLKLAPSFATEPIPVVAADLLHFEAKPMKLLTGAESGEIEIRRDVTRTPKGEFNPSTGALRASIPVEFTAAAFMNEGEWVRHGEVDSGPEPRPALVTMLLSGSVEGSVLSARATIRIPQGVPLYGGSTLVMIVTGAFAATVADLPRLSFNLNLKTVADDTFGNNMVVSATEVYTALDEVNAIWSQCCIDFGVFAQVWTFTTPCTGLNCIPSTSSFPGSDGNLACAALESTTFPGSDELEFMFDYSASPFAGAIEVVIVDRLTGADADQFCLPNAAADGIGWGLGAVAVDLDRSLSVALAHELGHVLIDNTHHTDPSNLMSETAGGLELTLEQCLTARDNLFWSSGSDCSQ